MGRKIVHILDISTDQKYHVDEKAEFFLIVSCSQLLRMDTQLQTTRDLGVHKHITSALRSQSALSMLSLITTLTPQRLKSPNQKSDLKRNYFELEESAI